MILDGKKLADKICRDLKLRVDKLKESGIQPELIIVTSGDNDASKVYVRNKVRRCEEIGIIATVKHFDFLTRNNAEEVCAMEKPVIFQLPITGNVSMSDLNECMRHPIYDVDGFISDVNIAAVASGKAPYHYPCTPLGIMKLLDEYEIDLDGKTVCIIGRSNVVGRPLARMMERAGATVTVCHSLTTNHAQYLYASSADIIVSATGYRNVVNISEAEKYYGFPLLEQQILIDVGMNRDENSKLCGDFDSEMYKHCKAYTPVPGGVGPMTVAMLMENVVHAYGRKSIA